MLRLEVVRVVNGIAECRYFYDKTLEEQYKKDCGSPADSKEKVGKYISRKLWQLYTNFKSN